MRTTSRRHRVRTTCIALACSLVVAASLCGCVEKHDRDDIEAYVRSDLGLSAFVVSDEPIEVVGEDGYSDYIWTVFVPYERLRFHVIDDYYWGGESLTNLLENDYEDTVAGLATTFEGEPGDSV